MSLKLEENQVVASFGKLMDDDLVVIDELSLLASNIRREVFNVLDFFLSFLRIHDGRKTHAIWSF
jgi:archaellum biogenesis ATPase FlaH